MESDETPRSALNDVAQAQAALADRARAPRWYHPALGLLVAGLIAVQAAGPVIADAYIALFCLGLVLLMQAYRRHTGLWINGWRRGRTRLVALGFAVATSGLLLASVWLRYQPGLGWAPLAAAPVAFVVVTAAGFLWESAYRADLASELGAGAAP
ncbi:MAG TPA: hypothetical protein VKT30_01070 [Caulobacteraceae bacterium]|nr:hypothetical protein [Caulobacteraceae bacterium]